MSDTQLITIGICIATIINQWSIAIFNKKAKETAPKTPPVDSVAKKARTRRRLWFAADFGVLIGCAYALWTVISPNPIAGASLMQALLIGFLSAMFMSTTRNITARLQSL